MTILCPCCRARNTTAVCRRCKADLGLLVQLEARRAACLGVATVALAQGNGAAALSALAEAQRLRPGDDRKRESALANLLAGNWAAAIAAFREL